MAHTSFYIHGGGGGGGMCFFRKCFDKRQAGTGMMHGATFTLFYNCLAKLYVLIHNIPRPNTDVYLINRFHG